MCFCEVTYVAVLLYIDIIDMSSIKASSEGTSWQPLFVMN